MKRTSVKTRTKELMAERQRKTGIRVSYRELAAALDISKTTIDKWMNNKVKQYDSDMIVMWCNYFDCEIGELLVIE